MHLCGQHISSLPPCLPACLRTSGPLSWHQGRPGVGRMCSHKHVAGLGLPRIGSGQASVPPAPSSAATPELLDREPVGLAAKFGSGNRLRLRCERWRRWHRFSCGCEPREATSGRMPSRSTSRKTGPFSRRPWSTLHRPMPELHGQVHLSTPLALQRRLSTKNPEARCAAAALLPPPCPPRCKSCGPGPHRHRRSRTVKDAHTPLGRHSSGALRMPSVAQEFDTAAAAAEALPWRHGSGARPRAH